MIACPTCRRRVFTPRDLLYATVDRTVRCRFCGGVARLDMISRWLISCMLALILPMVLLYGGVFYSGHLLVISMVIIFGAWGFFSWIAAPFLGLEAVAASGAPLDRSKSIMLLALVFIAAIVLDSFIASRFEPENTREAGRSPDASATDSRR